MHCDKKKVGTEEGKKAGCLFCGVAWKGDGFRFRHVAVSAELLKEKSCANCCTFLVDHNPLPYMAVPWSQTWSAKLMGQRKGRQIIHNISPTSPSFTFLAAARLFSTPEVSGRDLVEE